MHGFQNWGCQNKLTCYFHFFHNFVQVPSYREILKFTHPQDLPYFYLKGIAAEGRGNRESSIRWLTPKMDARARAGRSEARSQ